MATLEDEPHEQYAALTNAPLYIERIWKRWQERESFQKAYEMGIVA